MIIEDKLPEHFRQVAFHPSAFVYAWKKSTLEKLFQELNRSNIAIKSFEAWIVHRGQISSLIPLSTGDIKVFRIENALSKSEEWPDVVERCLKDTMEHINGWNLEKQVLPDKQNKVWYHFRLADDWV